MIADHRAKARSAHFTLIFLLMLLSGFAVLQSHAQESKSQAIDEASWNATFKRIEAIIDEGTASTANPEQMRAELAEVRRTTSEIVQRGSIAVKTLQAQLETLGPPPAEGETEPTEISVRRAQLSEDIGKANAPILAAQEANRQADVLIQEIDRIIRDRDAEKLLKRYPSPLLPTNWLAAGREIGSYYKRVSQQVATSMEDPGTAQQLRDAGSAIVFLLVFGILALVLVQPLAVNRFEKAIGRATGRRRAVLAILESFSRLFLPVLGVAAILAAVNTAGITPFSAKTLIMQAPAIASFMIVANWLGYILFKPNIAMFRMLPLEASEASWGLRLCQGLGLILALQLVLESIETDFLLTPASIAVISTPVIFAASFFLWRMAALFQKKRADMAREKTAGAGEHLDTGFLNLLAWLMKIAAIAAIALILLGYVNLARQAMVPMILTVGLLGFGLFLYHLIMGAAAAIVGHERDEFEGLLSLLPIAVVFMLALALSPLLALTWGARSTDIGEVWRLLTEGVEIGDMRISLDVVITLVVVFTIGMLLTRWLQQLLRISVLPRTRLDPGAKTALVTGFGYVGMTIAALAAVSAAGLNLSSLAVVAGALSLGIGFGLQTIVSNFVSGIILLIERPIKEGDWIEVSGQSGLVRKISVRSTRIETFDRHDVIVPNSDLIAGIVKNMTLTSKTGRLILPVGVAYGSDLEKTKSILLEKAKAHPAIAGEPEPAVLFMGLGESSLDFELRCYLNDIGDILTARSDLLFEIYVALGEAGIEIPFPQRDIHLRDIDRLVTAIEGRRKTAPAK